jgi:hypothetical protein
VLYRIETPSGGIHESATRADYTHMRCLYCGKELALLKRLTGSGDFCSDAHKRSYQEEYNRLALSRLLQAQKKGQQGSSSPAQTSAPVPSASAAVEEAAPQQVADDTAMRALPAPALEEASGDVAPEELSTEVSVDEEVPDRSPSVSEEPEPLEIMGFLLDSPALTAPAEEAPYLESWLELAPEPAMCEWQLETGATFQLSPTDLLALDLRATASAIGDPALSLEVSPQTWPGTRPDRALLAVTNVAKKTANANRLPTGGAVAIDIALSAIASAADHRLVQGVGFENTVLFDDSGLLELASTAIDFPAEDSDVVVPARCYYNGAAHADTELEAAGSSPRASLVALSRLHQELVEQEAARAEPMEAAPNEVVRAVAVEVIAQPEAVPDNNPEVEPHTVEISAEPPDPPQEASKPKCATELFEIPMRTFAPAKPALLGGDAFPAQTAPLLPHLKSLPLRPKVSLATGYVPPSNVPVPSEAKAAAPAAAALRIQNPPKPPSVSKPAARLTRPKPVAPSSKPVQPAAAKAASVGTDASKPAAKPGPSQPAARLESTAVRVSIPEVMLATPPAEELPMSKPAAETAKPAADQTKPAAEPSKPKADPAKKDNVPNFDIAQPANASWLGSLKLKLGLAIVLLIVACVYFLDWGGKSRLPAMNPGSSDGSGPSIIMGEGGWVESWGGDPAGLHAGRQITIYRPSLKLADYRLEFQASIDVKSVGWVFRASDPNNYYAMKLMTIPNGLSPKVALYKYLVANGRQTQVGRVPIDLPVQQDTVFDIRVDVRGPQFATYIQGRQVDSWTDDQLKIGGAGFLNEREERGKVKSVSIRYLSGAGR